MDQQKFIPLLFSNSKKTIKNNIPLIRKRLSKIWVLLGLLLLLYPLLLYFFQPQVTSQVQTREYQPALNQVSPSFLTRWKTARDSFYQLFLIGLILEIIFWSFDDKREIGLKKSLVRWFLGLSLCTFSYALAGLIIDFGFFFWYLWRGMNGT